MNNKFKIKDQISFALLSGDNNPIHVDKIYSRRTIYGEPVVHGINLVFFALEIFLSKIKHFLFINTIKIQFKKPAFLDRKIEVEIEKVSASQKVLLIYSDGILTTKVHFSYAFEESNSIICDYIEGYKDRKPKYVSKDKIKECSGIVDTAYNSSLMIECYPNVSKYIRCDQIGVLLATSRVIGMHCPGLNSLFSECELNFSRKENNSLSYDVEKFDERLNYLTLSLNGTGLSGKILAFVRPEPVNQKSFTEVKEIVGNRDFDKEQVLIIGGSRGLGEIALKVISAGGGRAIFTYFSGEEDALNLVSEINNNGGNVSCIKLDVTSNSCVKLVEEVCNKFSITSCYYFATPKIISQKDSIFSTSLYKNYYKYYIEYFINIASILEQHNIKNIFYPSTIFIDRVPDGMAEYVSVKVEAETLFSSLNNNGFNIYFPRLPPLATDQTVKLYGSNAIDSCDKIYEEIIKFKDFIEKV